MNKVALQWIAYIVLAVVVLATGFGAFGPAILAVGGL